MRKTNFGKIDALAINGEQEVPMVILKNVEDGKDVYEGFVPGLLFNLVRAQSIEECEKLLKDATINHLKQMYKQEIPFPFFPDKKDIEKDFKSVKKIIYLKISSKNRKNN